MDRATSPSDNMIMVGAPHASSRRVTRALLHNQRVPRQEARVGKSTRPARLKGCQATAPRW